MHIAIPTCIAPSYRDILLSGPGTSLVGLTALLSLSQAAYSTSLPVASWSPWMR